MMFKKIGKQGSKINFNTTVEIDKKIIEIADFYLCNKTDVINVALQEYIKKFDKKIDKIK